MEDINYAQSRNCKDCYESQHHSLVFVRCVRHISSVANLGVIADNLSKSTGSFNKIIGYVDCMYVANYLIRIESKHKLL